MTSSTPSTLDEKQLATNALRALDGIKNAHGSLMDDHAYFDCKDKSHMVKQHRPWLFSVYEEQPNAEFHRKQTFMVTAGDIAIWGPDQERRVRTLDEISRNAAGARATFTRMAIEALQHEGGSAAVVDWRRVEDACILKSIKGNHRPPQAVYKAIAQLSPAAVTPPQRSDLRDRVMAVAHAIKISRIPFTAHTL